MKHSIRAFLSFYLGKILAVAAVCTVSSVLGRQLLDENGRLGGIDVHLIVNICMIAMGVWFVIKWILDKNRSGCGHCRHCGSSSHTGAVQKEQKEDTGLSPGKEKSTNRPALFAMGALFWITSA